MVRQIEKVEKTQPPNPVDCSFLEPSSPNWNEQVDRLRESLGAPNNPFLFPPHFIKKTLISIGGGVLTFAKNGEFQGAGFLFPKHTDNKGRTFTLRLHKNRTQPTADYGEWTQTAQRYLEQRLKQDVHVAPYVPEEAVRHGKISDAPFYTQTGEPIIVRTPQEDAGRVREMQRTIWDYKSDDFLYPPDIHFEKFGLATSLLAYVDGKPIGFLFGFDKVDHEKFPDQLKPFVTNYTFRTESQLIGLLPEHRNHKISERLKIEQAKEALAKGVEVINWTFDPLQAANAVLNLNKLRGIIWSHYPNYYAFAGANKLNQVIASRFSVTWLVTSPRVQEIMEGRKRDRNLIDQVINGRIPIVSNEDQLDASSDAIAIEIPVNWTKIQQDNPLLAAEWRNRTDEIFQRHIGIDEGKFVITDVAVLKEADGVPKRDFLIAQNSLYLQDVFMGFDTVPK